MSQGEKLKIKLRMYLLSFSSMKETQKLSYSYGCYHLQISQIFSHSVEVTGQERTAG